MKTPTQQAIEDAVAGGFNPGGFHAKEIVGFDIAGNIFEALLMPDFWQAVAKTRGWALHTEDITDRKRYWKSYADDFWMYVMRGRTIDDALAAITKGV